MSSPDGAPSIVVVSTRIDAADLKRLVELFFVDMVKLVVDVERTLVAVGGELHADAEAILLEAGSSSAGATWPRLCMSVRPSRPTPTGRRSRRCSS